LQAFLSFYGENLFRTDLCPSALRPVRDGIGSLLDQSGRRDAGATPALCFGAEQTLLRCRTATSTSNQIVAGDVVLADRNCHNQ